MLKKLDALVELKKSNPEDVHYFMEYEKRRIGSRNSFVLCLKMEEVKIMNDIKGKIIVDTLKEISGEEKNFSY